MENSKTPMLSNQKLLMIVLGLFVINISCLSILTKRTGAVNLDGTYAAAGSTQLLISALLGFAFSFPLLIAIVTALISLMINKQQPYGKRFLRLFLWMLAVFYAVTAIRFGIELFS